MVLVRSARMQHVGVGDELDIPDFEDHVQRKALASLLQHFDGFQLFGRQRGDYPGV